MLVEFNSPFGVGFILAPRLPTRDGTGVGSTKRISRCATGDEGTCIRGGRCPWELGRESRSSFASLASATQSLNPSLFETSLTTLPNVKLGMGSGGVWIENEDSDRIDELDIFRRGSAQCLSLISLSFPRQTYISPPSDILYPFPILDYIRRFRSHCPHQHHFPSKTTRAGGEHAIPDPPDID